jgi:hypothetical protein
MRGFKFLTAAVMTSSVFWDITPVVLWKSVYVSEEYVSSIFRVKEWANQETSIKPLQEELTGFLFGLFLYLENGGNTFLQNICWLLTDYKTLYTKDRTLHTTSKLVSTIYPTKNSWVSWRNTEVLTQITENNTNTKSESHKTSNMTYGADKWNTELV